MTTNGEYRVNRGRRRSTARRIALAALFGATALAAGCGGCHPNGGTPPPPTVPPTLAPTPAPTAPVCSAPTIDVHRSLVVHDPAQLAATFSLQRTLQQIIDTSGNPATTPAALLQTMLDSFNAASFVQPVSGKTIPVTARPQEAALPAADLLNPGSPNGMAPNGLFNRLDLAPSDGSNCGEYRIVYAKRSGGPLDRFFIIFEAKLPNPTPGSGLAGCQPVAQFWANLSTDADPAARLAALERFYYTGLPGTAFGPVVTHANYGLPLGQVRTNLFISQPVFMPWVLREHRTSLDAVTAVPIFVADTVKQSPLAEWFRLPAALPPGLTPADQQAFRAHFLHQPACNLTGPDLANAAATQFEIVNGIGGGFDPAGDDFQSVSSDLSDDPADNTDPALGAAVTTRLAGLGLATVDATHLLNRTGAMTCGGCHQFSNNRPLNSSGAQWPASAQFVHIREDGTLSDALNTFFLPQRAQFLSRFFCDPTAGPAGPPCPAPPGAPAPAPAAGLLAAAAPTPDATLAAASGLDAAAVERLTRGRTSPALQQVDAARLALLGAARQVAVAAVGDAPAARRTSEQAAATLAALVERAKLAEQALPGAFVPVRRAH